MELAQAIKQIVDEKIPLSYGGLVALSDEQVDGPAQDGVGVVPGSTAAGGVGHAQPWRLRRSWGSSRTSDATMTTSKMISPITNIRAPWPSACTSP